MNDLRDPPPREARTLAGAQPASGAIDRTLPEPPSQRAQARDFLLSIPAVLVVVPLLFRVIFGVNDEFSWGFTAFLVVLCALGAVGMWAQGRPEPVTPAEPRGGLADPVGGLWLVACAFGPFGGWILGQTRTLTDDTWRILVGVQWILTGGIPLVTMVPNLRYARGGSRWIALGILFGVTLLPVAASYNHWRDLRDGPVDRPCADGTPCRVLPHSGRLIR